MTYCVLMRQLYTILFYLFTPFILLRLYWRGFKAPEYRNRWKERLALYGNNHYSQDVIWIHAVSVGESEAVFPLIRRLQSAYPNDKFLITTTTPTGSERVKKVMGDSVLHVYLPYDLPVVVQRFIAVFQPKIAIIMEKEIWPNLYKQCDQSNIPLMIINARLSLKSATAYKKIPALVKPALTCVHKIATQTEEDKQNFIAIGAESFSVDVTGNIKFDIDIDKQTLDQALLLKNKLFAGRYVFIVASTHSGEEAIFYALYPEIKKIIPNVLLVVVPRHPERFVEAEGLARDATLKTCVRSTKQPLESDTDVYIVDTMGELKLLYGAADISFVGGSMVPVGGHNILEPAALNIPVIFGPYMTNSKEMAKNVVVLGAAIQCLDQHGIIHTVRRLFENPVEKERMVATMADFLKNNRGATERTQGMITTLLEQQ